MLGPGFGRRATIAVTLALLGPPRASSAQELSYFGTMQAATGRYVFQERTTSVSVWTGVEARLGRLRLATSIPVIAQSSPWLSTVGPGMLPSGGPEHGSMTGRPGGRGVGGRHGGMVLPDTSRYDRMGIGDPTVSASAIVWGRPGGRTTLRVLAAVKPPLATPTAGFGTGAWDYGVGAGLGAEIGRLILLADGTYWSLGDLPELRLNNTFAYSLAVGGGLWSKVTGLVSVAGWTPVIDDVPAAVQFGVGGSVALAARRSVGALLGIGLTDGAPAFSAGLSWRVGL